MYLVTLIANRTLKGNYGLREAGQSFQTDNITADQLERRGLARRFVPPVARVAVPRFPAVPPMPETEGKMYAPPEDKMVRVAANKVAWPVQDAPPVKRGRGRPKGSKNKPK